MQCLILIKNHDNYKSDILQHLWASCSTETIGRNTSAGTFSFYKWESWYFRKVKQPLKLSFLSLILF